MMAYCNTLQTQKLDFTTLVKKKEVDSTKRALLAKDTSGIVWQQNSHALKKIKNGILLNNESIPDSVLQPYAWLYDITTDHKNNIWISTNEGVIKKKGTKWTYFTTAKSPLLSDNVRFISVAPNNSKWIVTDQGITILNDDSSTNHWDSLTIADNAAFGEVKALTFDDAGRAWIGTYNGNLIRYDKGQIDTPSVFQNKQIESTMPISQLLFDIYGNLWVGTLGRGLLKISPDGTSYKAYTTANSALSCASINRMYAAKDSCIYVGTAGGGIYKLKPTSNLSNNSLMLATSSKEKSSNQNKYDIYPNPSAGIFTIVSNRSDEVSLSVSDLQGKKLNYIQHFIPGSVIDLSSLSAGIYFITVSTPKEKPITLKINIQK